MKKGRKKMLANFHDVFHKRAMQSLEGVEAASTNLTEHRRSSKRAKAYLIKVKKFIANGDVTAADELLSELLKSDIAMS